MPNDDGKDTTLSHSSPRHLRGVADLHQAVRLGDIEMVSQLIECGVDMDGVVRGTTPLSLAITLGRGDVVELLIDRGADVDKLSRDHNDRLEPPLFTSCRLGMELMAEKLLKASANADKTDFYNQSPLWIATRERRLDLVRLLLDHGASVNVARRWNECPLYLATKYLGYTGRRDIAKLLVHNGIDVNVADDRGRTPLYWALKNCDDDFARILVLCGGRIRGMPWTALEPQLGIDLRRNVDFYEWFKAEMSSPTPLKRLCMVVIRKVIACGRGKCNLVDTLRQLPLPAPLIRYLTLEGFL